MKCEKCNEKDANFFYTATINGETTQRHLCADCAQEEGFGNALNWGENMLGPFAYSPFEMFSDFFGGQSMLDGMMAPVVLMPGMRPSPQAAAPAQAELSEAKIPADAGGDVRAKRELTALKHQLNTAIKDENFERAIELRDKIKELER